MSALSGPGWLWLDEPTPPSGAATASPGASSIRYSGSHFTGLVAACARLGARPATASALKAAMVARRRDEMGTYPPWNGSLIRHQRASARKLARQRRVR